MDPFRRGLNRSVCVLCNIVHLSYVRLLLIKEGLLDHLEVLVEICMPYTFPLSSVMWLEMYEYEWQFLSSKLCFPWVWEKNRDIMWYGGFHITIFHTQWNWHESWYSFLPLYNYSHYFGYSFRNSCIRVFARNDFSSLPYDTQLLLKLLLTGVATALKTQAFLTIHCLL